MLTSIATLWQIWNPLPQCLFAPSCPRYRPIFQKNNFSIFGKNPVKSPKLTWNLSHQTSCKSQITSHPHPRFPAGPPNICHCVAMAIKYIYCEPHEPWLLVHIHFCNVIVTKYTIYTLLLWEMLEPKRAPMFYYLSNEPPPRKQNACTPKYLTCK